MFHCKCKGGSLSRTHCANDIPCSRDGANPGFHEAVGDVVALSAATPQHLKALGLMSARRNADITQETQTDLNHLFTVAMAKIAFLPFALVLDKVV